MILLLVYDFLAILFIICFAYNWKALSLLSTSAALLVSLMNMSIYSVTTIFMRCLQIQKQHRIAKKLFKKHPTFISTKHMLSI